MNRIGSQAGVCTVFVQGQGRPQDWFTVRGPCTILNHRQLGIGSLVVRVSKSKQNLSANNCCGFLQRPKAFNLETTLLSCQF